MLKKFIYLTALCILYFLFYLSLLFARLLRKNAQDKLSISFNMVRSYVLTQAAIEIPLAIGLFFRGHNVTILIDDGLLTSHDTMQFGDDASKWYLRQSLGNLLIKQLNQNSFKVVFYSHMLKKSPLFGQFEERFSMHVRSSLVRFYRSVDDEAVLQIEDEYEKNKQLFQKNAAISMAIGEALACTDSSLPQILVTSHALYSTWGPLFDVLNNNRWPIYTYAVNGFVTNGIDIGVNEPATFKRFNPELFFEREQHSSLVEDLGRDLLSRRIDGESEDVKRITDLVDYNKDRLKIETELYETTALMLPNVLWDNVSAFSKYNIAFDGICDWISKTIAWYIDNPKHLLVIKPHPGEGTLMDVKIRVEDYIKIICPKIEDHANIMILSAAEKNVKTSTLFNKFDKFLIYNGTVLYEAIEMQQPIIVVGEVPLNNEMGLYAQPDTISDYYALLKDKYIKTNKPGANFYHYCGVYFRLSALSLDSLSNTKWQAPKFGGIFMAPFKCQGLEKIVNLIEKKSTHD